MRLLRLGGLSIGAAALGTWLHHRSSRPEDTTVAALARNLTVPADPGLPELVVVQGDDPRLLARRALAEMGGAGRFIARGDVVVIKPNVAWDRTPEQAANTNPLLVAELVRLCQEAGAKRVIVTDVSCNEARRCFQRSGIGPAAAAEGAEVILPEERRFREVDLRGDVLRAWPVLDAFLSADKIINVPIAKHHDLTGVTLGIKNWYGMLGGPRHRLHQRIHESLADLAAFIRPTLTLIDGYRILLRNGPTGGNLEDVALKKTLIACTDPVAADAYAAQAWWNIAASQLRYLQLAAQRGLGTPRFESLRARTAQLYSSGGDAAL
ncbi:MAG: DUF362 domain-containing protein [Terriglobales bacterium]